MHTNGPTDRNLPYALQESNWIILYSIYLRICNDIRTNACLSNVPRLRTLTHKVEADAARRQSAFHINLSSTLPLPDPAVSDGVGSPRPGTQSARPKSARSSRPPSSEEQEGRGTQSARQGSPDARLRGTYVIALRPRTSHPHGSKLSECMPRCLTGSGLARAVGARGRAAWSARSRKTSLGRWSSISSSSGRPACRTLTGRRCRTGRSSGWATN